jgi:hypothetical protein
MILLVQLDEETLFDEHDEVNLDDFLDLKIYFDDELVEEEVHDDLILETYFDDFLLSDDKNKVIILIEQKKNKNQWFWILIKLMKFQFLI